MKNYWFNLAVEKALKINANINAEELIKQIHRVYHCIGTAHDKIVQEEQDAKKKN